MPRDGTYTKPDTEAAALLRKAKVLIDTPEKWCQGTGGQDLMGRSVSPLSRKAIRFCSIGASSKCGGSYIFDLEHFLNEAAQKMGFHATAGESAAANLNDTTDHPTVMAMFDLAIRLANEEAA